MHLILVHLGKEFHFHIFDCIEQIRIFNPNINLHLLVQTDVYNTIMKTYKEIIFAYNVILKNCDLEEKSNEHLLFQKRSNLDRSYRNGFVYYCTQRFLVLHDYILNNSLVNIIHIEYDNLIFCDLNNIINILEENYNCGAVFDNSTQCVPSFVYFKNLESIQNLMNFIINNLYSYSNDMLLLGGFRNNEPENIQKLPILTEEYTNKFNIDNNFSNNISKFQCIFDARAIGQYIGGIDSRVHQYQGPGYINPDAHFKVNEINVEWREINGLFIPYACEVPVVNLHIHSKDLKQWLSNRKTKYNIDLIITGERLSKLNNIRYIKTDYINDQIYSENDIILSHNSDYSINENHIDYINKVTLWMGQNININHEKLVVLPIGIANSEWTHGNLEILSKIMNENNEKTKLCYYWFNINTNPEKRTYVKQIIDKNIPEIEWQQSNNFEEYLRNLSKHTFAICPVGNGIDTHRMWECLNLKVVPIVERNYVTEAFEYLGLYIVDDWNNLKLNDLIKYKENVLTYNKPGIINMDFYNNLIKNI